MQKRRNSSNRHNDVIKWKHLPRNWPFVREIHRSPVNSPHKGQWRGALMFSLICARINGWVNNREAGDWRRHRAYYAVTVMSYASFALSHPCVVINTHTCFSMSRNLICAFTSFFCVCCDCLSMCVYMNLKVLGHFSCYDIPSDPSCLECHLLCDRVRWNLNVSFAAVHWNRNVVLMKF